MQVPGNFVLIFLLFFLKQEFRACAGCRNERLATEREQMAGSTLEVLQS